MNKVPDPTQYERKDIGAPMAHSIGSKDCTSNHPRVLMGKVPKGKRRSFLDQAIWKASQSPDPGHYPLKNQNCDRLDCNLTGAISWSRQSQKTKSIGKKAEDLAPNHYNPSWSQMEERLPNYTVPKEVGKNFLDKAVKEKWSDAKSKKELPGPGTYNTHNQDDSKHSRGTRHLQLRGLTQSPMSGYF